MLTSEATIRLPALLPMLIALTDLTNPYGVQASQRGPAWVRHTIDCSSRGADGVRLADVNEDGLPDITSGWEQGDKVRVYLNPGPTRVKQKWPAVTVGNVGSPEDAVFVDLDHDGAVDVVSCCEGKVRSMWVHWAPKERRRYLDPRAWKTEPIPAVQDKQLWMFCLPLQVDGKCGIDLVAGSKGREAQIGWLESPADPRDLEAWRWHPLYEAGWIMSLEAVDMDDDGDLDVLASDRKGQHRGCLWLEHPGPTVDPRHPWKEHRLGPGDKEVMFLDPVDLDRDGLLDVLVPNRSRELIYHRRQTPHPPSWDSLRIPFPPGTGAGKAVRVGDIDLDGRLDIVISCGLASGKSGVVWMSYHESVRDRVWEAHEISGLEGSKFDLVQLLDLDGDGDLDVITCEERDNLGVIWYENPLRP